jgi:glycosyltransferase involved in cell wall biosynthesis
VTLGVVIRFKNSSETLPAVLESLLRQRAQPDVIIGIDTGSTDASAQLLRDIGAQVVRWTNRYEHSAVLNSGIAVCPTDVVMALSSHSVLQGSDETQGLLAAFDDPQTACASVRHPRFGQSVGWDDLAKHGLTDAAIYSNSAGAIRRSLWASVPFNESAPVCEDHEWAVGRLKQGYRCRLLPFSIDYRRPGPEKRWLAHWRMTFALARFYRLPVAWPGRSRIALRLAQLFGMLLARRVGQGVARYEGRQRIAQLVASVSHAREFAAISRPTAPKHSQMADRLERI